MKFHSYMSGLNDGKLKFYTTSSANSCKFTSTLVKIYCCMSMGKLKFVYTVDIVVNHSQLPFTASK